MRKLVAILVSVLLTVTLWAQAPQKMSYQTVVRNSNGLLVSNTDIGLQINIRKASPAGDIVYTQTLTPSTNANGLVSVEIGGTGFNAINWADGMYFIETKIDIEGGTDYNISGTSQLLSVPYALHAKTAESMQSMPFITMAERDALNPMKGEIIYNTRTKKPNIYDGEKWMNYDGSPAIIQTPVLSWENPTYIGVGVALSAMQLNATAAIPGTFVYTPASGAFLPLGNNQTLKVDFTPSDANNYNSTSKTVTIDVVNLTVGLNYQGGVIAYVLQPDDPGYDANVTHGLIAAPSDQSNQARWGCYGSVLQGADGTALGTGAQNTVDIITFCNDQANAAKMCSELVLGGYSDWYLPSKDELNKLYLNKTSIGSFLNGDYRSSSEVNEYYAWTQNFDSGVQSNNNFKDYQYRVRAVRSF